MLRVMGKGRKQKVPCEDKPAGIGEQTGLQCLSREVAGRGTRAPLLINLNNHLQDHLKVLPLPRLVKYWLLPF